MPGEKPGPEAFEIPYHLANPYLDGAYLLVNAVPDTWLVYNAHDCGYYKAEKIAGNHDLFSDLLDWKGANRIVRTNLDMAEYVLGSDDRLSKKLLQVVARHRPASIVVANSNPVVVCGHDTAAVIRDLSASTGVPMIALPGHKTEQDHVTGYYDALRGVLELLRPRGKRRRRKGPVVWIVGYLFGRREGDDLGNVVELRRLLRGIGARVVEVIPDGSPLRHLRRLAPPDLVVDLSAGECGAVELAECWDAGYLSTDLPLGIDASERWLRGIAARLGLQQPAEEFIARELAELLEQLEWITPRFFAGRSTVVVADRLLLHPLGKFLEELGFLVTAVGCSSGPGSGSSTRGETAGGWANLPERIGEVRLFLKRAHASGELDVLVANSIICQLVGDLPLVFLELGYPANYFHCLRHSPYLGFQGVRVLVERLVNGFGSLSLTWARTGMEAEK